MSLLTKQAPIDPHDVPLNSLVAQEQVDVNIISRNNFNNNAYMSNFGSNNPRLFPSNNYGNNNTYPSTKNSTSELESMLKDFMSGPGVSVCKSRYNTIIWRAENHTHLSKKT